MCWASNLVRPRRLQLVPIEQHEVLSPLWLTCYSVYDRLRQAESWFGLADAFAPLAFGARGNEILLEQSLNLCLQQFVHQHFCVERNRPAKAVLAFPILDTAPNADRLPHFHTGRKGIAGTIPSVCRRTLSNEGQEVSH